MIEIWEDGGITYRVSPEMKAQFLNDHPQAQLVQGIDDKGLVDPLPQESWDVDNTAPAFDLQGQKVMLLPGTGETKERKVSPRFETGWDWLDNSWLLNSMNQASAVGESLDVFMQGSNVDMKTIKNFVDAEYERAANYKESERMANFNKKYEAGGKTWASFFGAVLDDTTILPELFVSSLGTQIGSLLDSSTAQVSAGLGFGTGFTYGYKTGPGGARTKFLSGMGTGLYTSMAAVSANMETGLTFAELIREELGDKEFNEANIKALLESPKGETIRNRALGRGLTISGVELLTGWAAGKATTRTLRAGKGRATKFGATTVGLGVESVGGGVGEILGREVAGQEFDIAEVGFEAITGTTTAPLTVGKALLLHKDAKYKLNREDVSYKQMRSFIETAEDIDIATANIEIENDLTGLDALAYEKQQDAIYDSQIDSKITGIEDRKELVQLQKDLVGAKRDLKKEGHSKVPGAKEKVELIEAKIDSVVNKYKGAIGIGETAAAKRTAQTVRDVNISRTIEFAETQGDLIGKKVKVVRNSKQAQDFYNKLVKKGIVKGKDVTKADGFIAGDVIIINKDVAGRTGAITVGSHEILHGIVAEHIDSLFEKDKAAAVSLGKSFINVLNTSQKNAVLTRLKNDYKLEGDAVYSRTGVQEMFTAFSDAIEKGEITFNETVFDKVKNILNQIIRVFTKGEFQKEFRDGRSAYNFLKDYQKNVKKDKLGKRAIALAGRGKVETLTSLSEEAKAQIKETVDEIGQTYSFEGGKELWDKAGGDAAVKEIERNGYFDDLIAAKWKGDKVPKNFVKEVMTELSQHVKNFNPEVNNSLFGWINSQVSNKAAKVFNENYKDKKLGEAAPIEEKTKEGEVKVQVAAEEDVRMKQLEVEDLSLEAQAKKKQDALKAKEKKHSKFRRKIGIETGSDLYNKVLDAARQSLLKAYEAGTSARNIQRKLRDQANSYLFKDIKNFLGTKEYINNLKEYRTSIVDAVFTADFVQMEAKVADSDRIFTKFVKKLTSKAEVEAAVENNLLPKEALNVIDKGTAVNLYEKRTPSEKEFIEFFNQPAINPKTGARSGLKGTRKDGLARAMAGALSYDATMQVAQEPEVAQMREEIASLKGETLASDDIQQLASAIGRGQDVLFSQGQIISGLTAETLNTIKQLEKGSIKTTDLYTITPSGEKEFSLPKPIKKWWTKQQKYSKDDQSLVAKVAYNTYTANEYGKITNYELNRDSMKKVIKGRKKGKNVKLNHGFEQLVIDNVRRAIKAANSNLKSNKKTKEGIGEGDVYINLKRTRLGIEVKMHIARGVSQLMSFITGKDGKPTISFPNKNETLNENGKQFDDVIGKKILSSMNKLKAKVEKKFGKLDGYNLTPAQKNYVDEIKNNYLESIFVNPEYVAWHYGNGKYSTKPQGLVQFGEKLYWMETGNEKVDALTNIVVHNHNQANPNNKIEQLQLNDNGQIELVAQVFLRQDRLQFRMSPILDITSFKNTKDKGFKANLLNKNSAVSVVKSIDKTMKKIATNDAIETVVDGVLESRSTNKETKGITVLDFDDTLATSKSLIRFTKPDGTKGTLTPEQYASTYESLLGLGYKFDFSEFSEVIDGKPAPLLNKAKKLAGKFGTKDMFILTARPADSATAIHEFLKANGLNIPIKNITGLGNSTAEAKALWMLEKVGEGYNDFYFADDAIQNVKEVKSVLEQVDVKSKVQQAKVLFSKSMDKEFNQIIEQTTGVETKKTFSSAMAKILGAKNKYWSIIPASAQDFAGLLYNFLSEGQLGEKQFKFLKETLIDPFAKGYNEINVSRQNTANQLTDLYKQFKGIKKKLKGKVFDTGYTVDQAVRVYLWERAGHKIPGLTTKEKNALSSYVKNDPELKAFANEIGRISGKKKNVPQPGEYWVTENIVSDLLSDGAIGDARAKFLKQWKENVNVIFSEKNLNKIEAVYGSKFVEALKDILYRMETGKNRPFGANRLSNIYMNWCNGAVGAIMFFNVRSAVLQTISATNYINWTFNNPLKAGLAFANQTQFWKDFAYIFNSDMLKQRRSGNRRSVNESELSMAVIGSSDKAKAAIAWLLQKGFLPTQIADSFAISIGGAAYYRNSIKEYKKQGFSEKEAEKKAWIDFQETTETAQ
jgi:hypothetical protein